MTVLDLLSYLLTGVAIGIFVCVAIGFAQGRTDEFGGFMSLALVGMSVGSGAFSIASGAARRSGKAVMA